MTKAGRWENQVPGIKSLLEGVPVMPMTSYRSMTPDICQDLYMTADIINMTRAIHKAVQDGSCSSVALFTGGLECVPEN